MSGFSVQDGLNLLSKLTLRRVWNALRVLTSYYLSKYTGRAVQWGLPISISVEPTTSCNLRCPECPSGLRSFTRATDLNPAFLEMVRYASQKKIYTATSTNAHYLTDENARRTIESGLDRLIISIDGTTQEVYEQYRVGGQLQKVLDGAARVVKWKKELRSKTPFIVFQFLVVRPNEHQIEEARQLARRIGVDDIWFKTAQIYDYEKDPHQLIPTRQEYSRYRRTPRGNEFKGRLANHCWRLWHDPVITWNGLVAPCCFDKDAQYKMGNLQQQSFVEIWRSEPYRQFRAKILQGRKQIDICSNCSEGTRVWGS
ncbi:MAG: radical SAM protein [Chitinophagia bacterium]|nr:radical SAM protein [Chitinophagia bacterium]